MRSIIAGIVCLITFFMVSLGVKAAAEPVTYYVAPDGDDAGEGTLESPWATFATAVSEAAPGVTIYVRGGIYTERLNITESGEEGRPIVFAAYPGENPVLDGTKISLENTWTGLVNVNRRHDIVIDGFTVRDSSARGIMISDSSRITVKNNTTVNTVFSGVQAWGNENLIIDGNTIINACTGDENIVGGTQEHISVSHSAFFEITGNIVSRGGKEGIDVKNGAHDGIVSGNTVYDLTRLGIYIDGYLEHTYNIDVFGNEVYRCQGGIRANSEEGGLVENISIYGNILHDNAECGITIRGCSKPIIAAHTVDGVQVYGNSIYDNGQDGIRVSVPANGSIAGIRIFNNTISRSGRSGIQIADFSDDRSGSIDSLYIYNNTVIENGIEETESWGDGGIYVNAETAKNVVVRNNIVSDNRLFSIGLWEYYAAEEVVIENNLIHGFRDARPYAETKGVNCIEADPLFVDPVRGDYRLNPESPAIDAGVSVGAPGEDFAGFPRPQGAAVDIGAFEAGW